MTLFKKKTFASFVFSFSNDNYFRDDFVLSKKIFVLSANNFSTMKNFTSNEMSFSSSSNQILWFDFDDDLNSSVSQSNFSMFDILQLRKKLINVINETKIVKARLQTRINALLTRVTILKREIKISKNVYDLLNDKIDEIETRINMQKINRASSAFFSFTQLSTSVFISDQDFHAIFSRRQNLFSLFHHWRQKMLRFLLFFSFVRQESFEFFFEKFLASLSFSASLFLFRCRFWFFFSIRSRCRRSQSQIRWRRRSLSFSSWRRDSRRRQVLWQ